MSFKDAMGALAVVITLVAYGIYVWQTLRGETRPHPLSWLIFGILTGTAYLVQRDEAAGAGSWVMGVTAVVCLLLCLMSFWRGERAFPGTSGRSCSPRRSSSYFICCRGSRRSRRCSRPSSTCSVSARR